jgi:hypothetical protein
MTDSFRHFTPIGWRYFERIFKQNLRFCTQWVENRGETAIAVQACLQLRNSRPSGGNSAIGFHKGEKTLEKRLYAAYGSNLNVGQMAVRCPTAKLFGTGVIENYELRFKGFPNSAFATIAPKPGAAVPVALWKIRPKDELSLDRYEGCPSHYYKENIPVTMSGDGGKITAMVYIMNQKMKFGAPSEDYYNTVFDGYTDCGFDTDILNAAVENSVEQYREARREINKAAYCMDENSENLSGQYEETEPDNEYEEYAPPSQSFGQISM